ncbi:ABC transporter permease subunit [Streptomyces sp. NBC_00859]|uniref:ABC transporter permease subunit n=1 Tax=Streptomyces sp. NBC_00859 TaxID=2903682 RepID=UPI00386A22B5|nr:ABC transporter permease subunit [Streptomyces sp. NBC_00859]
MTAASLDKPAPAPSPSPSGPDLFRAELRLHRAALWSWTAFVVVTAGLLLWLYGPGADATQKLFDKFGYAGVQQDAWRGAEFWRSTTYNDLFYDPATLIGIATFCVALFAAGPLIARELESGTTRLAWSQSVSPARWLAAKLAVPALVVTVGTGLLILLYRLLWSSHSDLLRAGYDPRHLYFSIGPAAVVAPLLALAIGALCGLLLRRTVPAMAVAGIVQYVVLAVRSGLWPFQRAYQVPELSVHSRAITSTGARIADPECYDKARCLAQHDVVGFTRTYLPSSDFWPRQLAESGVLLALTALAVGIAFWVLKRRTV